MYFSRIRLRPDISSFRELPKGITGNEYQLHRQVWKFFDAPPDAARDFLYRFDAVREMRQLYLVSRQLPHNESGAWLIDSKPYDPLLSAGTLLSFSLRFNPTRDRKGVDGKRERHDVVMDAKKRKKEDGDPVFDASLEWLHQRGDRCGFENVSIISASYQRKSFRKGSRQVTFGVVDVTGYLDVKDATAFRETLFNGLGRGRGFGMGLLMVRRP